MVRYTLVGRSPSGTENVSFEGIRCKTGEYRVYALGRADRTWSARASQWKPVEPKTANRQHQALRRQYFCPVNSIIQTAEEGVSALRLGGHPRAVERH